MMAVNGNDTGRIISSNLHLIVSAAIMHTGQTQLTWSFFVTPSDPAIHGSEAHGVVDR